MNTYNKNYATHTFKAGAYIRLSREDGDKLESDSIKNQREFIDRFINNEENIEVYKYYVDDGYTGTNFNRPSFNEMMTDVENGYLDCVIVKDLSRFGRDYIDMGRYLERILPKYHIRFIAITDGIDNLNQRYDISMPIKNIVNAQYAEDISKKVMAAISTKQKNGQFIGAFSSYGYMKDPTNKNKLIIDEPAALIVKRIYSMFLGGIGTQTIARKLNSEGIPCPSVYKRINGLKYNNCNRLDKTNYWTYSTVRNILRKRIYAGDMVQHITNASRYNFDSRIVPKEEHIIVSNTHEAIIDREEWETVQSMIDVKYKSTSLKSSHIFSGIVKCRECGRGLTKIKRGDTEVLTCGSYKRLGRDICSEHQINMETLSQIVLNAINEQIRRLCDIKSAITHASKYKHHTSSIEDKIKHLNIKLDDLKNKKRRLYEDYQDRLLTRDEYVEYNSSYASDIELIAKEIQRLESEIKTTPIQEIQKVWVNNLLKYEGVQELSRELLTTFVDVIYISETPPKHINIEIVFNFNDKICKLEEAAS